MRKVLAAAKKLPNGDLIRRADSAIRSGLRQVQKAAQEQTPIDEGTLRASAQTQGRIQGQEFHGSITFGGMAARYAEPQHEREDYEHPKGGTHHYLYGQEHSAWDANEDRLASDLERRLARRLERQLTAGGRG